MKKTWITFIVFICSINFSAQAYRQILTHSDCEFKSENIIRGVALMEAITYIISDVACIPQEIINPQNIFEDLGVDSLDFFNIVTRCEYEFGIEISTEEYQRIKTVQDLHDTIHPKLYV